MVSGSDCTTNSLASANRPILLKGRGADDAGLVGAGALVDVVGAAIRSHLSFVSQASGGVICSVGLDDVVFNEWAGTPSVDGEVAVAGWREGS